MEDFVVTAAMLRLGYAAVAGIIVWLVVRALMRSGVARRHQVIDRINSTPESAARFWSVVIAAMVIAVAMMLGGCSSAKAGPLIPSKYDHQIKSATAKYWGDFPDWLFWKGQLYQESRLDPAAVSPVGAAGLAQFMPATWKQITRELRLGSVSPHHEIAVEAGAYYMAKLRRAWSAPRPALDRHELAEASYNAGLGTVLAAQRVCSNAPHWLEISACLDGVSGAAHARETKTYVIRIAKWRAMLAAGG